MRHWRPNADPLLRDLERRAATGDPEAVLAWATGLLRAGQLPDPADRNAVGAANILAEKGWYLVRRPGGFVIRHALYPPDLGTIEVSNDPDRLGYQGHAVGWRASFLPNRALTHFRVGSSGGVLHPDSVDAGDMASPEGLARAAELLRNEPGFRLLGAITLAADEGKIPRHDFDWYDTDRLEADIAGSIDLAAGGYDADGLRDSFMKAAGLPPGDTDLGRHALGILEQLLMDRRWILFPVDGFSGHPDIPIPRILRDLKFSDQSWGNDAGARSTLTVSGPDRRPSKKPGKKRRKITWHGEWPELFEPKDEYELHVWSHGLHPGDQEAMDGIRYSVVLNTKEGYGNSYDIEIGEAQNEQGLAMILLNLGLKP